MGSEPPPGPEDEGQQQAGIVIAIGDVEFGQVVYDALRITARSASMKSARSASPEASCCWKR